MRVLTILFLCYSLCYLFIFSTAVDTIAANETIRDGETIISADESFELGFFSPGDSKNRYLGIWYKKIATRTVVWVANRDLPLNDSTGVLQVTNQGILVLLNGTNSKIWSSDLSEAVQNPVAQLLDTGNLVLREGNNKNPEIFLWQSFDHLGDTLLPGAKFGKNLITAHDNYLTSSKSADDPSSGDYTARLDPGGYPQFFVRKGSDIVLRSGPWNGLHFSVEQNLKENTIYSYEFVCNEKEIFYRYELKNSSVVARMVLKSNGAVQLFAWVDRVQNWNLYFSIQIEDCDRYASCGAYGSCNINNNPACGCLEGFVPKVLKDWEGSDWSSGCVRRTEFECGKGEGFRKILSIKVPDTRNSWFNRTMNLKECEEECLKNCSCTAYANLDIRDGGSGCLLWFDELIDVEYTENGQDIYIRLAASELETSSTKMKKLVSFIVIPVLALGLVFLFLYYVNRRKLKRKGRMLVAGESKEKDLELPLFDLATITDSTNNFSDLNKIGEGGYGPVYKGMLSNGQEIAVKRLSKYSTQGLSEFKNEVLCIAKLQHRNLVKLLGCCIQVEEKILIYEYMPNKSLDAFIFSQNQSRLLDWPKRTHIIKGIARGLLYLHQDSRLRVIHRDLKAANILLDNEMNPKISDFGMARTFGGQETEANTKRVAGTYGYMSPEYAIDGVFSIKSDVFSFGVLVLEIVSGRRNKGFHHPDYEHNLLGHAWRLYKEGRPINLIDEHLKDSCIISEVLCSIHVGLLCVQKHPEDRPSMATVVLMLTSEVALPEPKVPGFYVERNLPETNSSSSKIESCSANNMSITLLTAR